MRYVSDNEEKTLVRIAEMPYSDNVTGYGMAEFIRNNDLLQQFLESPNGLNWRGDTYWHGRPRCTKEWMNMEEIRIGDQTYYREIDGSRTKYKWERYYKEVPGIYDDGHKLKWAENARYDAKETSFTQGMFEFHCIVKATGDAIVEVKYAKCENKHRNRVTIAEIEVIDATNKSIMDAITKWKKGFLKDVESIQKAA